MKRDLGMAALIAASFASVEPLRDDAGRGKKAKGKLIVPPRTLPKLQSESLKRMLRKAKP